MRRMIKALGTVAIALTVLSAPVKSAKAFECFICDDWQNAQEQWRHKDYTHIVPSDEGEKHPQESDWSCYVHDDYLVES